MHNKIVWLRIAYWVGIVADAIAALLMLFPALCPRLIQANLEVDAGLRYGLRFGASLMVGWTVLLFWADRKPAARKDVLLITFCPVVVGLMAFRIYTVAAGLAAFGPMLPNLLLNLGLAALFTFSYFNARDAGIAGDG